MTSDLPSDLKLPVLELLAYLLHPSTANPNKKLLMKIQLTLLAAVAALGLVAQQDLTTPLLHGSWQATFSNPALLHNLEGNLTIGLPGIYNDLRTENVTYGDLLVEEGGQTFLDPSQAIAGLEERNELRDQFDFETVGLAIKGDRFAFSFGHRIRYDAGINYPKTLAQVIWEGNAQFIGQTVDIRPDLRIQGYHELGLGVAYQLTDNLSIGARVKYLSGINDLSTQEGGRLELTTDDVAYALELDQDLTINSSGSLDYQDLRDFDLNAEFANFTLDQFLGGNSGFAFDLGAQLDLGNIRIQASAQDLGGGIDWSENVSNFTLSGVEAFTGLDVLDSILDDEVELGGIVDSLEEQFEPQESNLGYRTELAGRYLIGGELDVNEKLTLGALVYFQEGLTETESAAALSARYRLSNVFQVGAVYAYRAGEFTNLGVNATLSLGPARLLIATDNLFTAIDPKNSNQANVRLGLSLSFLKDRDQVE